MSWNCQSVRNKRSELSLFAEKNKIDIILLSETWLSKTADFFIPSFECYRVDRSHGGVAILIKHSIPHSSVRLISLEYAEAVFVKIHDSNGDFSIGAIYCSPAASRAQSHAFFSRVLSLTGRSVISGDFNAKNSRWNSDRNCRKGSDLVKLCDSRLFSIHGPDSPTLIPSRGNPSTVDFVLSKAMAGVSDPLSINDLSSDHLPLTFNVPFNFSIPEDCRIFNYAKANWKKFRQVIQSSLVPLQVNFYTLVDENSIDRCIKSLNNSICSAIEYSVPKKLPYRHRYPYSPEIHNLTKSRNFYRRKFKETLDSAYRSVANQLSRLIKSQTALLNQNTFDDKIAELDPLDNSLFKFSKQLKNRKSNIPPLVRTNSLKAYSNKDKADSFAEAFLGCHQTTGAMRTRKEKVVSKSLRALTSDASKFPHSEFVKDRDVLEIVRYLKIRKAPGPDKIPNLVIRNLPPSFISFLTHVFNSCLNIFYFPREWKIGKIVAIPKPGKDKAVPTNYRPISLLSNLGKVFERILLIKLLEKEDELKIIIPQQFGFRNGHSTVQQILRITEHASRNFNLNRSTGLVLLDIEKAFDSVWHNALIHKLMTLKFPIYLIKLVKSYLQSRKAFVEVNGQRSFVFDIPAGVPQGSLLSPLLFNIFINDVSHPKDCQLAIYADDTALFCDAPWKNVKKLKKTLEKALEKVSSFFNDWKIKINSSKTEFSVFTHSRIMKQRLETNPPVFDGNTFQWKDSVKYLGVHLDQKLNFQTHIQNSIGRSNKAISILYCLLKKNSPASFRSKLSLYKTYVRPLLTYACPVFANCPKTHFNRLQVMQNKCLRMVLSAPFYTRTTELHRETNLPTIRSFVDTLSENFYRKAGYHSNELISSLGKYTTEPLPFRVKHRMPRAP